MLTDFKRHVAAILDAGDLLPDLCLRRFSGRAEESRRRGNLQELRRRDQRRLVLRIIAEPPSDVVFVY